jgi:hypothetical protein
MCHDPFLEDNLFVSEIKPLQLTILLYLNQFQEMVLSFLSLDFSHVPAEQATYRNVCYYFGS